MVACWLRVSHADAVYAQNAGALSREWGEYHQAQVGVPIGGDGAESRGELVNSRPGRPPRSRQSVELVPPYLLKAGSTRSARSSNCRITKACVVVALLTRKMMWFAAKRSA